MDQPVETPPPISKEELRDDFLKQLKVMARYWAGELPKDGPEKTVHYRLEGLVHSFLAMIDGCSPGIPNYDLVARPHPDDKEYCIGEGMGWIEDGTVINDDVHLHNSWHKVK